MSYYLGLMCGSSLDGIDAALLLLEEDGTGTGTGGDARLVKTHSGSLGRDLAARIQGGKKDESYEIVCKH